MDRMEGSAEIVRFPVEKRRDPLIVGVEEAIRARWSDVLAEPIPGHLLVLISRLERVERELLSHPDYDNRL
jgi:hypothetical protein